MNSKLLLILSIVLGFGLSFFSAVALYYATSIGQVVLWGILLLGNAYVTLDTLRLAILDWDWL